MDEKLTKIKNKNLCNFKTYYFGHFFQTSVNC